MKKDTNKRNVGDSGSSLPPTLERKPWLKIVGISIPILVFVFGLFFEYVKLSAKNTELANAVDNSERENKELKQIRERYFALVEKLILEGKVSSNDLVASLPQNEVERFKKREPTPTPAPAIKAEHLLEIIKQQQKLNVKESYGEMASQNFSVKDLEAFKKEGRTAKIVADLKKNNEFLDTVLAVKALPPTDRQKLFEKALTTYKPTWEQLGRVDREGQTVAGQEAEKMIAEAIVDLVKDLSKLSDEDFKKLYA